MPPRHRSHRRHRNKVKWEIPFWIGMAISSIVILVSLLFILNKFDSAPLWQFGLLVGSAAFCLIITFAVFRRANK